MAYINVKEKFERRFRKDDESGCWVWLGPYKSHYKHGIFHYGKARVSAHRYAMYLYENFDLDSDLQVNHSCSNPSCVNPKHLYVGTQKDNIRDSVENRTHHNVIKTHCPRGHEYTIENTYYGKSKRERRCRICAYYQSKRHEYEKRKRVKMSENRSVKLMVLTNEELILQLIHCERAIQNHLGDEDPENLNLLKTFYVERQHLLAELTWRDIAGEI